MASVEEQEEEGSKTVEVEVEIVEEASCFISLRAFLSTLVAVDHSNFRRFSKRWPRWR